MTVTGSFHRFMLYSKLMSHRPPVEQPLTLQHVGRGMAGWQLDGSSYFCPLPILRALRQQTTSTNSLHHRNLRWHAWRQDVVPVPVCLQCLSNYILVRHQSTCSASMCICCITSMAIDIGHTYRHVHGARFGLTQEPVSSTFKVPSCLVTFRNWLPRVILSHKVHSWLQGQSVVLSIEDDLDVSTIGNAKSHYAQTWHQSSLSSVARYQPLQPKYALAPYLSAVKGFKSRKLISRFRCGFHGLHVDTGRLLPLTQQVPRVQRYCVFCASGLAEDEHHFVFDCPAYCAIRNRFTNIFWGPAPTLSSFFTLHDPKVIARF